MNYVFKQNNLILDIKVDDETNSIVILRLMHKENRIEPIIVRGLEELETQYSRIANTEFPRYDTWLEVSGLGGNLADLDSKLSSRTKLD